MYSNLSRYVWLATGSLSRAQLFKNLNTREDGLFQDNALRDHFHGIARFGPAWMYWARPCASTWRRHHTCW